jgi:hypothetical protein
VQRDITKIKKEDVYDAKKTVRVVDCQVEALMQIFYASAVKTIII